MNRVAFSYYLFLWHPYCTSYLTKLINPLWLTEKKVGITLSIIITIMPLCLLYYYNITLCYPLSSTTTLTVWPYKECDVTWGYGANYEITHFQKAFPHEC